MSADGERVAFAVRAGSGNFPFVTCFVRIPVKGGVAYRKLDAESL